MIVLDTSAWIEYLIDSKNAEYIEEILDNEDVITPSIVLVELSCKSEKEKWNFEEYLKFIKSKSEIIGMDEKTIIKCGKIYTKERKRKSSFGIIDAIILTIAKEKNAKVLTKDNDFLGLDEAIMLK